MIFGAILAGGIGNRMSGLGLPKQFLPLGISKKPILIHTLEKFILCQRIDCICVGVHKEWVSYAEELLDKYHLDKSKVIITEGGNDRNGTIMNIVSALEEKYGEDENHIIVTHDSVRPFVTFRMINESIDAAIEYGACDTVVAAVDTIVESTDGVNVTAIPDRVGLYQGQTPQSFNMMQLKNLYNSLNCEERKILTDACKIFVFRNKPVKIIEGDAVNMKVTTVSDYKIADAILGGRMID